MMLKELLKFLFRLLIVTVLLLPVNYYLLEEWVVDGSFNLTHYLTYFYFISMAFCMQYFMLKGLLERPGRFTSILLGTSGLSVLITMLLLLMHLYVKGQRLTDVFPLNFMILFAVYFYMAVEHAYRLRRKTARTT